MLQKALEKLCRKALERFELNACCFRRIRGFRICSTPPIVKSRRSCAKRCFPPVGKDIYILSRWRFNVMNTGTTLRAHKWVHCLLLFPLVLGNVNITCKFVSLLYKLISFWKKCNCFPSFMEIKFQWWLLIKFEKQTNKQTNKPSIEINILISELTLFFTILSHQGKGKIYSTYPTCSIFGIGPYT